MAIPKRSKSQGFDGNSHSDKNVVTGAREDSCVYSSYAGNIPGDAGTANRRTGGSPVAAKGPNPVAEDNGKH